MTEATSPATALVDALSGIDCPVTLAEQIGRVARDFGNLPPTLALLRGRALDEAVAARHRVADLAERLDISEGRLYEILRQFRARIRATVSDPTKTSAASVPSGSGPLESSRTPKTADAADLHVTVATTSPDGAPA